MERQRLATEHAKVSACGSDWNTWPSKLLWAHVVNSDHVIFFFFFGIFLRCFLMFFDVFCSINCLNGIVNDYFKES